MKIDFPNLPSYQQFCKGLEGNFMYLAIIGPLVAYMIKSKPEVLSLDRELFDSLFIS